MKPLPLSIVHINSGTNLICLCLNFAPYKGIRSLYFIIMFQFEDNKLSCQQNMQITLILSFIDQKLH